MTLKFLINKYSTRRFSTFSLLYTLKYTAKLEQKAEIMQ